MNVRSLTHVTLFFLLAVLCTACSGGGGSTPTDPPPVAPAPAPQLALDLSDSPIDLQGNMANFASNVSYGSDPRHVFDVFLPDSDESTALAIYIHGGGFTGGNKESAYESGGDTIIRSLLAANIAFATINYRLLADNDPDGVIKPMTDSQNALQFYALLR